MRVGKVGPGGRCNRLVTLYPPCYTNLLSTPVSAESRRGCSAGRGIIGVRGQDGSKTG